MIIKFRPAGLSASDEKIISSIFLQATKGLDSLVVYVFGSRATGKHQKYSDLDLWIESNPPLSADVLGDIREKLIESDLSFKVDLVTSENCVPDYRDNIEKPYGNTAKAQQQSCETFMKIYSSIKLTTS